MIISKVDSLLLWLAGVEPKLVHGCSPATIGKRKAMGGLLLIPVVLAGVAGYTFFVTLFKGHNSETYAVIASVTWGFAILCLDRFLLMTLQKSGSIVHDFLNIGSISRLFLAGLVAVILAHPIVLRVYQDNLSHSIQQGFLNQQQIVSLGFDQQKGQLNDEITARKNDLKSLKIASFSILEQQVSPEAVHLRKLIKEQQTLLLAAENEYTDEVAGRSKRTSKKGVGPVALAITKKIKSIVHDKKALEKQLKNTLENRKNNQALRTEQMKIELVNTDNERAFIQHELDSLLNEKADLQVNKKQAIAKAASFESYDFLTLSNQLDRLSGENSNVKLWTWLITALLFFLDIIVILMKITSPRDEYDDFKDAYLKTFKIGQQFSLGTIAQRIEFAAKRQALDEHIIHNLATLEMLLRASAQIMSKAKKMDYIEEKNRINTDDFKELSGDFRRLALYMRDALLKEATT